MVVSNVIVGWCCVYVSPAEKGGGRRGVVEAEELPIKGLLAPEKQW